MSAPEVPAAEQAPAEPKPAPTGQRYRVEALATGVSGAVKLMILTTVEPTDGKKEDYKARASAQYRVEFDEWADGLKVTVAAMGAPKPAA